jgi:hypothetical protein
MGGVDGCGEKEGGEGLDACMHSHTDSSRRTERLNEIYISIYKYISTNKSGPPIYI